MQGMSMFLTTPGLAEWVPEGLRENEDCHYWRAVMLTTQNPWYLLVYRMEGSAELRTVAVSWESRLMEVIHHVGPAMVVSISRVHAGEDGTAWRTEQVDEIWAPASQELSKAGPMLLRVRGDVLRDSFMSAVKPTRPGRRLLLNVAAPSESGPVNV